MRFLRLSAFFILGLLLGGYTVYASAATYPATVTYGGYTTKAEYCTARTATYNSNNPDTPFSFSGIDSSGYPEKCSGTFTQTSSGYTWSGSVTSVPAAVYSCAGSGSLNSNTQPPTCSITCPDGQTPNAQGQCVAPCVAGQSGPPGTFTGTGDFPSSLCINGCSYGWTGVGVQIGNTWALGAGKGTGVSCTGNTSQSNPIPPEDPKTKCVQQGMGFGTVNGVTVCTTPTATKQSNTTSSSSTNSSTSNGSTSSTTTTGNTTSTTTCTGDTCTTTTTTNTSSSGGAQGTVTGQQESTTTQSKADFCKDNPTNKVCSTLPQDDFCEKNPDSLSCMKAGTPTTEDPLTTVDKSLISSITPVSVSGSGGCPALSHFLKASAIHFNPHVILYRRSSLLS